MLRADFGFILNVLLLIADAVRFRKTPILQSHSLIPISLFYAGVFTGAIIRMISDIRAKHGEDSVKLDDCGKFTLAEDLSDIKDITSIDLSRISSLEGT